MKGKILVTGGAGYIGSFVVKRLKEEGFDVSILDNLSSGHTEAIEGFTLHQIDLVSERDKLHQLFKSEKFDGVIHMASFIQMGESFKNPGKYYINNVYGFINLMDAMVESGVKNIIISSSAGVYGNPSRLPIEEDDPKNPLNPYGETKYMIERIVQDYEDAFGIKHVSIRYFNAAGAALDGSIGEAHPQESHLIANIITKALKNEEIEIFGDDYDTADGTCVRDYIHVLDLAENHVLAMEKILDGGDSSIYNAGIGRGYSNKEIIAEVEKVTGLKLNIKFGPKRAGDASALYASNQKMKAELGWEPKYDLEQIINTAYLWHKNHPQGYSK